MVSLVALLVADQSTFKKAQCQKKKKERTREKSLTSVK